MKSCLCVRPETPCVGHCTTAGVIAAACRAAHWHEDDDLRPWPEYVKPALPDTSEPEPTQ